MANLGLQEFAQTSDHEHWLVVVRALHVFGELVLRVVRYPYVLRASRWRRRQEKVILTLQAEFDLADLDLAFDRAVKRNGGHKVSALTGEIDHQSSIGIA
jgi:hypothetical protein